MEEKIDTVYRAKNVVKRYPIGEREVEILHGLDLEIVAGEFVLLIGPSGCGKSTFMYLLFGLEPPTTGEVFYKKDNLFLLDDNSRANLRSRQIAMVHQQPIWIKALSVRENIAFPLSLQRKPLKEALETADRLLSVLHLEKLANSHPHELSVGEQQRCSLIRSMITDPDVIFADEPTGSLDTDSSVVVMELLKKINEQLGKTIIMVTHNMSHLPYGTKIVSMLDGRINNVEEKRPPSKSDSGKTILDVISSWHTEEHKDNPSAEPELKAKPTDPQKPISTTEKRLSADITRAASTGKEKQ